MLCYRTNKNIRTHLVISKLTPSLDCAVEATPLKAKGPTPLEISYACSEITGNHYRNHWKSGNQASRQKS